MNDPLERFKAAVAERYVIERELGRGGMATVLLAQDLKHHRPVAVKILRPELAAALGPDRFLREIEIVAHLTHPHILPLHDSGEAAGSLYYVMPYVAGESLRNRLLREELLPLDEAVRIAVEVADALGYAHGQGFVHRDIKPENILLVEQHAVVADFGIARAVSAAGGARVTSTGISVGTPGYMSPEQASGEQELDGRSDIFSLGCVLHEMLTGRLPPGRAEERRAAKSSLHARRPTMSVAVQQVLDRALAAAPTDRFGSAHEFGAALAQARKSGAGHRPMRPRPRALLGVAVVLVAAAGWWAWARRGPPAIAATGALNPTHVAVLYFDDLSDHRTLGPVANGLTEDLIDRLGQVQALHVISANGARPFRDRAVPLDSIARQLKVGTVVAGSVTGSRARLRVAVRLIDAESGQQLQSQTFQRPGADLLGLRDSVAEKIASFLRERLGQSIQLRAQRASTNSVAAWELYQRAQALWEDARTLMQAGDVRAGADAVWAADSLLARAQVIDQRWILPIIARGWYTLTQGRLTLMARPAGASVSPARPARAFADWVARGMGFAQQALAHKPGDPQALALRGTLRYEVWRNAPLAAPDTLAAAERDLRAAVVSDPTVARAWYALAEMYYSTGRFTEAEQSARRALDADAYLSDAATVIADLYFAMLLRERFDEAHDWCQQGIQRFPRDPNFVDCELRILGWSAKGEHQIATAWRLLTNAETMDSGGPTTVPWLDRRLMVAAVVARTGLADSARAVLLRARRGAQDDSLAAQIADEEAYVRLLLGERDEALRLLTGYLRWRPQSRESIGQSPWFRPLRSDSRFRALVGLEP